MHHPSTLDVYSTSGKYTVLRTLTLVSEGLYHLKDLFSKNWETRKANEIHLLGQFLSTGSNYTEQNCVKQPEATSKFS